MSVRLAPATQPEPEGKARRRYAPRLPPEQRREQLLDAALEVILEQGYGRVSIEAVARKAGVTRPVVYDHFPNLSRLLHALVEREERHSLGELEEIVPDSPPEGDPLVMLATSVRQFLELVLDRPATWRLILLPVEGTPPIVRDHVERGRAEIMDRIAIGVRAAVERGELPKELDVELTAKAIRDLGEEAGRMVLTDPEHFTPERYERFVQTATGALPAR
jgi:AcrR family transcriptional regulator